MVSIPRQFLAVTKVEDVKKFLADPDAYAAANPVAAAPAAGGAAEAKKEEKKAQQKMGEETVENFCKIPEVNCGDFDDTTAPKV